MRVLMLSRDAKGLDPRSSTADRWRLLRDQGVELEIVIASRDPGSWEEQGIRVTGSGGEYIFTRLWRVYRLAYAKSLLIDLICAQDPFELGWIASRVARRYGRRFEIQDHGGFFDGEKASEPLWWLRSRFAWWCARRADQIRTVSPKSRDVLVRCRLGEKTSFLPIATDSRFREIERHPEPGLIVCVARLVPLKNVDVLIQALAALKKHKPEARLVLIGDGPERSRLEKLVQELGLTEAVQFVGEADPGPWLARASVFALLSSHEGWGLAAVEAAAAGVPVVMSHTGCASWLQAQGRAYILPSLEQEVVAQILSSVLEQEGQQTPVPFLTPLPEEVARQQIDTWKRLKERRPSVLVCAQAVDQDDPLFGFFHSWLCRMSAEVTTLKVLALRVGRRQLPSNVEVTPLRKPGSHARASAILTLWRESWKQRHQYETVFVRGDAQYLVLAGWLWRLLGKRVVFWYTHYTARSLWFWLGWPWAHLITTAAAESCPLKQALILGHHIDTEVFSPATGSRPLTPHVLLFGRISPVKQVPLMLKALEPWGEKGALTVRVVGRSLTDELKHFMHIVGQKKGVTWEDRDVPFEETPSLYRSAQLFINATPGSLDKTILEAAASGVPVIAFSAAYRHALPTDLVWLAPKDFVDLEGALKHFFALSETERQGIGLRLRQWVMEQHSLERQAALLGQLFYPPMRGVPFSLHLKRLLRRLLVSSSEPNGVQILTFHSFDSKGSAGYDIPRLCETVLRLQRAGFIFHRLTDFWQEKTWSLPAGGKHVACMVDDGTKDILPVSRFLSYLHIPFALAVPAGIQHLTSSEGMMRFLVDQPEMESLRQTKWIDIVGHGVKHVHLTELSEQELQEELTGTLAFLARQNAIPFLVYPRGRFNQRVAEKVKEFGFLAGFSTRPGSWTNTADPYQIPRYTVLHWMRPLDVVHECLGAGDRLRRLRL